MRLRLRCGFIIRRNAPKLRDIGKPKALEVWICRAYLVRRMPLWDRIRGTSLVITGILRWARIRGTYLLAYGCTILSSDPRYVLTYSSKIVSSDPRYVRTYLLVYYPEPTSGVFTYLLLNFLASPVFTFCFWTEPRSQWAEWWYWRQYESRDGFDFGSAAVFILKWIVLG